MCMKPCLRQQAALAAQPLVNQQITLSSSIGLAVTTGYNTTKYYFHSLVGLLEGKKKKTKLFP